MAHAAGRGHQRQVIAAQVRDVGAIVVRVVVRQSKVFYVLGEVNAPGSWRNMQ